MTDPKVLEKAQSWLSESFDIDTRNRVQELIDKGGDDLIDAFYTDLEFGTGGLRGVMGVGTNRINKYTLGMATQGLANYLKLQFDDVEELKVAIAHDSRNNSKPFARQIAEVLAGNGIKALLFEDLRPTPELSFAVREYNCHAGIVITASHNPPEYNGYKVYWQDGGQLVPPHDGGVINEVRKVTPDDIKSSSKTDLIQDLGIETDKKYLEQVKSLSLGDAGKDDLKIVFTPIHGTTITVLPDALKACGFKHIYIVDEQSTPDGNFPTVKSPNPEEAEALHMAVEKAKAIDADLVIGCDPDGDRVGLAVRNLKGELELINGNQAASVLIYYLLEKWKENGKLTGNEFIAKTVVTTELLDEIAKHYNVDCPHVLTGFKWIADLIKRREDHQKFIGGGEESYGYLIGDAVRDKDAVASAVMLAEAAAWAKDQGSSFFGTLVNVYAQFGYYREALLSITRKGKKGAEEIAEMMEGFRNDPPKSIAGEEVVRVLDYKFDKETDLNTGAVKPINLPASNVIQMITAGGTKVTARPSGTEPKIKFYFSVKAALGSVHDFDGVTQGLLHKIEGIKKELNLV